MLLAHSLESFAGECPLTPQPRCVHKQLVSLPPVGILNVLFATCKFGYLFTVSPISTTKKIFILFYSSLFYLLSFYLSLERN